MLQQKSEIAVSDPVTGGQGAFIHGDDPPALPHGTETSACAGIPGVGHLIHIILGGMGDVAVQLMASGDIKDISEARKIIAKGENLKVYNPVDADKWEEAYKNFVKIVK